MIGFILCFVLATVCFSLAYDEYANAKFGTCTAFAVVGLVFFYMAWLVVI